MKALQNTLLAKFRERGGFGEDISEWKNNTYIELSNDIAALLAEKLDKAQSDRLGTTVSLSTLKRFLNDQYPISTPLDPRKKVILDKICIYSGFQSYQSFMEAQETAPITGQTTEQAKKTQEPPKRKRSLTYLLLLPLTLVLALAFFVSQKNNSAPSITDKTNLDSIQTLKIVKQAVKAEFAAYKAVPNYESQLEVVKGLFWENGAAYKNIFNVVNAQKLKAGVLSNDANPSSNELLSITLDSINGNTAYVSTKEHWRIKWFDTKAHRYEYLYDTINTQTYILTKDMVNGLWKIAINNYCLLYTSPSPRDS